MKGLGVSPGIGIGNAFVIDNKSIQINRTHVNDTIAEVQRFRNAVQKSKENINVLYLKTLEELGEKEAQIFKTHELMLEDESFIEDIENKIKEENSNAEHAINEVTFSYIKMFENIKDEYLRERAGDIKEVMNGVVRTLLGKENFNYGKIQHNSIIIANDLTPSDTANLDKKKVAAMVTQTGGKTSHAAIIARMMGIPTVVGLEGITEKIKNNDIVICDGKTGKVIVNPSEKQLVYYEQKKTNLEKVNNELKKQIGLPTVTKDGYKVSLAANIGMPHDVNMVLQNDAEGIGLFRSEFIFMNRECSPTEEEQLEQYKEVLSKMNNKSVIIRTLDIGGDKEVPYFDIPKEMNPFLGYRAIRLCLGNEDVFRAQLRAILRASMYGNVKIMFPMISTMKELKDAKKILEGAKQELRDKNLPFKDNIEVGIMIEIPSAAIISDLLAKEVDFFSIGTNDLIQYTMAVDRMNSKLSHLYSQYHPALLRLIKNVINSGHKQGIWVGMCGEAAGDPKLIPVFLGMGLDELSMNATSILNSRYIIRNLNKKDMEQVSSDILNMENAIEIEEYLSCLFNDENDNYLSRCRKSNLVICQEKETNKIKRND